MSSWKKVAVPLTFTTLIGKSFEGSEAALHHARGIESQFSFRKRGTCCRFVMPLVSEPHGDTVVGEGQVPDAVCDDYLVNGSRNLIVNRGTPPFDNPELRRVFRSPEDPASRSVRRRGLTTPALPRMAASKLSWRLRGGRLRRIRTRSRG